MNRIKTAVFGNQRYQHNLSGENFATLVRQATAKTVLTPDEAKNREIIRVINDPESDLPAAEISSVLRRRLKMENPHKQYLAVLLTRDIMMACSRKIRSVYAELLYEIAVVAVQPSMPGTPAARKAKQAALEVLRGHERAGNSAFKAASGLGMHSLQQEINRAQAAEKKSSGGSTESVLSQLERFGTVAKSHSDVFCDMLMSSEPGQLEESLIGELMREMKQMQEMLPKLIDKASNMEGDRPEKALAGGMEALDAIENAFKVHGDVKEGRAQKSLKRQATEALEPRGSFTFPKGEEDLLSDNPTGGLLMGGGSSSQPQPAQAVDDDPFGLNALQEALDEAVNSKDQGKDPFALGPDPFAASPGTPTSPTPFHSGQAGGNPFSSQEQPPMPQYSQNPGYTQPQFPPQMMAPQAAHTTNTQFAQQPGAPSPFSSPAPAASPNPFSQQAAPPFQQAAASANPFAGVNNPFGQNAFGPPQAQQHYGGVQPNTAPSPGFSPGTPNQHNTPPTGPLAAHQQDQLQGFGSVNPFGPSPTASPSKQQAMGPPMGQPMGQPVGNMQGYGQPVAGGMNHQANVMQPQQQQGAVGQPNLDSEWDNFFADRMGPQR